MLTKKSRQMLKNPSDAPTSSKLKQNLPNTQEWMPIPSEGDDQSPQIYQQPQQCKVKASKQKKQKKTSTPDTDDLADDSTSNSSRLRGRSKKQTQFYGSPIRHALKEISEGQVVDPSRKTPPHVEKFSGWIFHLLYQLRKES